MNDLYDVYIEVSYRIRDKVWAQRINRYPTTPHLFTTLPCTGFDNLISDNLIEVLR